MELFIFARFHARQGREARVAAALREVTDKTRAEPGCVAIAFYKSVRDGRQFWIHSRFVDDAAFALHIGMPHTVHFLELVEPLIDHPLDINRTRQIASD